MKQKKMLVAVLLALSNSAVGQPTYNHDASVYNQFLVTETGGGSLTPSLYYDALHRGYSKWAHKVNKNGLRVAMTLQLEPQKAMAQEIDSALTYRAKIEAMNVADRTPKALDLAWQTEKAKIEKKFQIFRENINKIMMCGGSSQDYREWLEIYNCLQVALKAVRDAYMPLNERKKQYLEIYHDIVLRNQQLVGYVTSLASYQQTKELLPNGTTLRYVRAGEVTTEAYGRWKVAMAAGIINTK